MPHHRNNNQMWFASLYVPCRQNLITPVATFVLANVTHDVFTAMFLDACSGDFPHGIDAILLHILWRSHSVWRTCNTCTFFRHALLYMVAAWDRPGSEQCPPVLSCRTRNSFHWEGNNGYMIGFTMYYVGFKHCFVTIGHIWFLDGAVPPARPKWTITMQSWNNQTTTVTNIFSALWTGHCFWGACYMETRGVATAPGCKYALAKVCICVGKGVWNKGGHDKIWQRGVFVV